MIVQFLCINSGPVQTITIFMIFCNIFCTGKLSFHLSLWRSLVILLEVHSVGCTWWSVSRPLEQRDRVEVETFHHSAGRCLGSANLPGPCGGRRDWLAGDLGARGAHRDRAGAERRCAPGRSVRWRHGAGPRGSAALHETGAPSPRPPCRQVIVVYRLCLVIWCPAIQHDRKLPLLTTLVKDNISLQTHVSGSILLMDVPLDF